MSRSAMQQQFGTHMTTRNVRRVWAAISATPRASRRELAERLGLAYGTVSGAMRFLKAAGYISFPRAKSRAVTIVIPFVVEELK